MLLLKATIKLQNIRVLEKTLNLNFMSKLLFHFIFSYHLFLYDFQSNHCFASFISLNIQ